MDLTPFLPRSEVRIRALVAAHTLGMALVLLNHPLGLLRLVLVVGGLGLAVRSALRTLCRDAGKPLVVFFDEADCLCGRVLISFLRQLRDGYVNREDIPFPASIALIGMLDVRDYKAQIRPDGESLGQISPFNIISEDLMLRNFSEKEIAYKLANGKIGIGADGKELRMKYDGTGFGRVDACGALLDRMTEEMAKKAICH